MKSASVGMGIHRKQSWSATLITACKKCGAPGFWHNTPGVNVGCYAPHKVTQLGTDPVGAVCPNCGAARSLPQDLGELWYRLFGSPVALFIAKIRSFFT